MRGLYVVDRGLVADHVAFQGMLGPGLDAQRQAIGLTHEEPALQGAARCLVAEEFEHAAFGCGLLPVEHPGGVGADGFLAGDGHFHVLESTLVEGEEEDAVVGGDVDEAVFGEILEHAFADPVVGGGDAEGESVAGAGGGLDFSAIDGDDLAEFREIRYRGLLQGADAVLGNDLADHQARGLRHVGGLADARAKARGRH